MRLLGAGTLTVLPPRAQVGEGNLERRALRAEKLAMREMLYPVLQAEEDRRRAAGRLPAQCPRLPSGLSSAELVVVRV